MKIYVTNLFDEKDVGVKNLVNDYFKNSIYKDFIQVNNQISRDSRLLKYNGIDSSHLIEVNINKVQKLTDFYSINKGIEKSKKVEKYSRYLLEK